MPTSADLAFRDAALAGDNLIEKARLLKRVSHEYLVTLGSDNSWESSAPFRYMIDMEFKRREGLAPRRANIISALAVAVSIVALAVAILK